MTIESGDIVRGDADGVVVVAKANASAVILDVERIRAQEARMDQWVKDGLATPPWLQEFLTPEHLSYLD
jgi:regulator of RNase E activity RraA